MICCNLETFSRATFLNVSSAMGIFLVSLNYNNVPYKGVIKLGTSELGNKVINTNLGIDRID